MKNITTIKIIIIIIITMITAKLDLDLELSGYFINITSIGSR